MTQKSYTSDGRSMDRRQLHVSALQHTCKCLKQALLVTQGFVHKGRAKEHILHWLKVKCILGTCIYIGAIICAIFIFQIIPAPFDTSMTQLNTLQRKAKHNLNKFYLAAALSL